MTQILDGKKLRDKLLEQIKKEIEGFSVKPSLAVILVGEDTASKIYVNNKKKTAEKLGITSSVIKYDENIEEQTVIEKIKELNEDENVNAILVQLPLPAHLDKNKIINCISPSKDVDCFTFENCGKLASGQEPAVYPCTPNGILLLLEEYGINLDGKNVVVVGRSNLVGKPMALLAMKKNATVTICHSHTQNLSQITQNADILISATGRPIIKKGMIKQGAIIIDVGIFKDENNKLRGDADFDEIKEDVSYITPVPGGIGPMTIASLMLNTLKLYKNRNKLSHKDEPSLK